MAEKTSRDESLSTDDGENTNTSDLSVETEESERPLGVTEGIEKSGERLKVVEEIEQLERPLGFTEEFEHGDITAYISQQLLVVQRAYRDTTDKMLLPSENWSNDEDLLARFLQEQFDLKKTESLKSFNAKQDFYAEEHDLRLFI